MSGPVLVVGFGPFLDVQDNPAARLARGLDGVTAGGRPIVGRVMGVRWRGCVEETLAWVEAHAPALVLGVGVARGRTVPMVERVGRRRVRGDLADVDGVFLEDLEPGGPELRRVALPLLDFAARLGATISDDAGGYVCNAWLYQVLGAARVPAAFLHVPDAGVPEAALCAAIPALWGPAATS